AVVISPRFTYLGPPGNANALISVEFTALIVYGYFVPGVCAASRVMIRVRYVLVRLSFRTGTCFSTSAADCRPRSTSCCTEKRLKPDGERLMLTCASAVCVIGTNTAAPVNISVAAIRYAEFAIMLNPPFFG